MQRKQKEKNHSINKEVADAQVGISNKKKYMQTKNKKERRKEQKIEERGITLIALIVTIIVLIVLAVVSINAIFGADGLVVQARRTDLIVEFTIYLEEKKTYDSEKKYEDSDYNEESLNAGRTTLQYNTQGEETGGNIQTVIPSMDDEYAGMFEIIKGEFYLYAASELEREVATELGIEVSPYLIDDGVLLSANANLGLQTEDGVVTLPERVTEIGEGAFSGVEGLKEVIVPGTVKAIQKNAFSYNTEIEKVTIEDGVLSIGEYAFAGCSSLKEVIIPDSVIEIGGSAFRSCTNLKKVQLSDNITSIESQTFVSCNNLTTINMPDSLISISDEAFNSCSKLDSIELPASVTSISSNAFNNCTSLYNLTIDEANTVYEVKEDQPGIIYTKDNSTLIMLAPMATKKEVTIREGIKRLEENSLSICTSMTTLNLPSSLEYITGMAFPIGSNTTLETINIPESNEYYKVEDGYIYSKDGTELVYVLANKTTISINEDVEVIKSGAMYNVRKATEIVIPDNVTTIESNIFRYGNTLKRIYIGKGLNSLEANFKGGLEASGIEITIDEENPYYKTEGNLIITKDGKKVVTYINKVQNQVVPEGIEVLGSLAFYNCRLTEITLPSTLKEIGEYCFRGNSNLIAIEIPNSVETIAGTAFSICGNLVEVRIDKEQGSISGSPWSVPKGERAIIWLR